MPDESFSQVDTKKAILQKLNHPVALENGVEVDVLRLDLIHPIVSGNKWFKLKNYLSKALNENYEGIATFGGAWSNHIVATAYACKVAGLDCIGFIRGEEPAQISHALRDASEYGMKLIYVPRERYRSKDQIAVMYSSLLHNKLIVPEGGQGTEGILGASEISALFPNNRYSYIACAVGTGTMLNGLMLSNGQESYIGISSLKLPENTQSDIVQNLFRADNRSLMFKTAYHFGGYGKATPALMDFMNDFYRITSIPTDIVYTAKLFYGVLDMIKKKEIPGGSSVCVIHSGGLQGNRSLANDVLCY